MEVAVIYPHQLYTLSQQPVLAPGRTTYLVEESLILTHNPIHRQKLIFHKLTLDAYQTTLEVAGYEVTRITIDAVPTTEAVFAYLTNEGVTTMHISDTTDDYLEQAILKSGLKRTWYESPQFILTKEDAIKRYQASKKHLARFYQKLRQDRNILIDSEGQPEGGQWSFDADNRKKLPKAIALPNDLAFIEHADIVAAISWAAEVRAEQYGSAGCWLPTTHEAAEVYLADFLRERLADFGPYEDALTTKHSRLFHSTLSPLINSGLLTPAQVLASALNHAKQHSVPLQSLEGFVRQILGWREFIRASYEADGRVMRSHNFFKHTRPLPDGFWSGETGIMPVDHAIQGTLTHGYNHHIERLMVLGNFLLLTRTHPTEVYRWFMGMYIDAYDWVMVPNIYGMSQFADGGSFATKPYISGSNYLRKMSHYPTGDWEATWTALYWDFIATHLDVFAANHRLSMMPRLWANMDEDTRQKHQAIAQSFLAK